MPATTTTTTTTGSYERTVPILEHDIKMKKFYKEIER
jgi:hypothetical protein